MSVRLDSIQHTVAVFGALMLTVVMVLASTPVVPVV